MRQSKGKGADLTFNMLRIGLGGEKTSPRWLFYAAPGGLAFKILVALALEGSVRQTKGKETDLKCNMLKHGLGLRKKQAPEAHVMLPPRA